MDDKTNLTPEQDEVQTGEEVSFTISGEDAAAQEALNAKKTAKKKSPLPWIIGGAAVVVAAALVLILTLKPKTVSPDAEQPGDVTISEPADTPDGTDSTQPDDQTPAEDGQTGEQADGEETEPAGNGISYTVEADALTEDVLNREIAVCGDTGAACSGGSGRSGCDAAYASSQFRPSLTDTGQAAPESTAPQTRIAAGIARNMSWPEVRSVSPISAGFPAQSNVP